MKLKSYMDMLLLWAAANPMIPAMMLKIPVHTPVPMKVGKKVNKRMRPKARTVEVVIYINHQ